MYTPSPFSWAKSTNKKDLWEETVQMVDCNRLGNPLSSRIAPRLYAILARSARTGVVLRRGPSRLVQLIQWDLRTDTFKHGQWLKGRIYERRCDLSPDGELLIYFAATYRAPYWSWTAISKPPFFTALSLWPKGDAWGGGGLFQDENNLLLNHQPEDNSWSLAPGFGLKRGMQVNPLGVHSGRGEDEPINGTRLARDGWRVIDDGGGGVSRISASTSYTCGRPRMLQKSAANGRNLQMLLHSIGRSQKAWYGLDYRVVDRRGDLLVDLPNTDWADWDGGDLVFARDGCLYRVAKSDLRYGSHNSISLLYDFNSARFTELAPPPAAVRY